MLCAALRSDPSLSTASSKSALPSPKSVRGPIVSQNFAFTPRRRGRGVERVMGVSINRLQFLIGYDREPDCKGRTISNSGTRRVDLAAVKLNDMAHNRKA